MIFRVDFKEYFSGEKSINLAKKYCVNVIVRVVLSQSRVTCSYYTNTHLHNEQLYRVLISCKMEIHARYKVHTAVLSLTISLLHKYVYRIYI